VRARVSSVGKGHEHPTAGSAGHTEGFIMPANVKALSRWLVIVACLRLLSGDCPNSRKQHHPAAG
jgi:hypothetical protein